MHKVTLKNGWFVGSTVRRWSCKHRDKGTQSYRHRQTHVHLDVFLFYFYFIVILFLFYFYFIIILLLFYWFFFFVFFIFGIILLDTIALASIITCHASLTNNVFKNLPAAAMETQKR